ANAGNAGDPRQRRRPAGQSLDELLDRLPCPFDLDHHLAATIFHRSGQVQIRRESVDKGSKTDPLDDALHLDLATFHAGCSRFCRHTLAPVTEFAAYLVPLLPRNLRASRVKISLYVTQMA